LLSLKEVQRCFKKHHRRRRRRGNSPLWKLFGQIWKYSGETENEDLFFVFKRSN